MIGSVATLVFCGVVSAIGALSLGLRARRLHARVAIDRRLGRAAAIARTDRGLPSQSGDGADGQRGRVLLAVLLGMTLGVVLGSVLLAVVLGGLGGGGLAYWARHQRGARIRACEEQMPRALEVMTMGLRAGRSLPASLAVAAEESAEPLRGELEGVVSAIEVGRPMSDALTDFAQRLAGCATAQHFVVAALVLQESGGNLIAVVEKLVSDARARRAYKHRLSALTAEGRSSALFLAALPIIFAALALLTSSSYSRTLLEDSGGRLLAALALGWWLCGIALLRRLLRPLSR